MGTGCTHHPHDGDASGLSAFIVKNTFFVTKSNKHIENASFTSAASLPIIPAMSIRNVKIDLLSATAVGVFVIYLLAPLVA